MIDSKNFTDIFNKHSQEFDHKHKLNLSNKTIDKTILDLIDKGIEIESLEALNLPICLYKTQITLHGQFDGEVNSYIGGYKFIFKNKNQSIGIKYNAIDLNKKKLIAKYLRLNGWNFYYNSSEAYFYLCSKIAGNKDDLKDDLLRLQDIASKIDTTLFYGNLSLRLLSAQFIGYQIVLRLDIEAVYQKNIEALILNITQKTIAELDLLIQEEQEKRRISEEAFSLKCKQEAEAREAKKHLEIEALKGRFTFYDTIPTGQCKGLYLKVDVNYCDKIEYKLYKFEGRYYSIKHIESLADIRDFTDEKRHILDKSMPKIVKNIFKV